MQKNAEKMDLSSRNQLLQVPTGSGHMTRYLTHCMTQTLTLGGSLYLWHSLATTGIGPCLTDARRVPVLFVHNSR